MTRGCGLGGSSQAGCRSRGGMARELSALLAIAQRDVVKLLRDRPRLAVNLAFPVMLVAGLGSVLQSTVGKVTGAGRGHPGVHRRAARHLVPVHRRRA